MRTSPEYTPATKNARTDVGTGGNPKIGVPVAYSRPHNFFSPLTACLPCPPKPLHIFSLPSPLLSQASSVKQPTLTNLRAPALPASALSVLLASALPASPSLLNEDTRAPAFPAGLMPAFPADLMLSSEGIIVPCVRKVTSSNPPSFSPHPNHTSSPPTNFSPLSPSVSWCVFSSCLSLYPSLFPLDPLTLNKTRQEIRHAKNTSARKTAHVQTVPHLSIFTFPLLPLDLLTPIRFRLYNHYEPFPPDPSHASLFPSPFN